MFPRGGRYAHSAPRCALCTTRTSHSDTPIVDIDLVALAIEYFPALRLHELWASFCVGTQFRQIAIHEIVKNVNEKAMHSSMRSIGATLRLGSSAAGKSQHG